ncbi:MAG TPA: integrase core domain-containing protein [Candidatus Limnocylindrales bacterium]
MAPADSLARLRKALMDRAERREAPVIQLCQEAGVSRSRFYELRARYRRYGEAGLRPKPRPMERPTRQVSEPLVDAIVAYAVEHPTHGERTIALVLATERYGGWRVSHGGVRNVLRRAGLGRRLARLAAAESLAASEGGPLTERVLRQVRAIERARTVHIGSDVPGEELFFDTFYVGNLKGVGKVWQLSAVDGASSFGIARVIAGDKTAAVMARFLLTDVIPACRRAGLELATATTDNGPEFGRAFGEACAVAAVRHHRIPPRSPNLNAFVERFQGTVLHLHYRVAFRYRYYTSAETIDADLQAWLRFYNFERPHRGYRTKGRTPASIFFSTQPEYHEQMGA